MTLLELKRATFYAWLKDGVPKKDVPNVVAALAPFLDGDDEPTLASYTNMELLTEITRRLALLERLPSAEEGPNAGRDAASGESLTDTDTGDEDLGTATIVGRGPSPKLGGNGGSRRPKDDR